MVDKFASSRVFPELYNYSFITQRSIINSPNRWKQEDPHDFEKYENIWIRVKEDTELLLQIVRVYLYFCVNSNLIQIRPESFPAKMFRAAIGYFTMLSLNSLSVENFKSCEYWSDV